MVFIIIKSLVIAFGIALAISLIVFLVFKKIFGL